MTWLTWEYMIERMGYAPESRQCFDYLNLLGESGWQLCAVIFASEHDRNVAIPTYYWKRGVDRG